MDQNITNSLIRLLVLVSCVARLLPCVQKPKREREREIKDRKREEEEESGR